MSPRRASQRPVVGHRWDGWTTFRVAYDAEWVAIAKTIPPSERTWDPDVKEWAFSPSYGALMREWTRRIFGDDDGPAQASAGAVPPDAFMVLHLQQTAPLPLVEASYRCLAKLAHPDRGGSHEHMIELTRARDALKELVAR